VCAKRVHTELIVSECDDFEDCDITIRPYDVMKSCDVIDDVTN